jgi:hypothetical protein
LAGLGECCTHVGSLLFKIEAVVRIRERPPETGVSAYWVIPSNMDKVKAKVGYNIDYSTAKTRKKVLDDDIDGGVEALKRADPFSEREVDNNTCTFPGST